MFSKLSFSPSKGVATLCALCSFCLLSACGEPPPAIDDLVSLRSTAEALPIEGLDSEQRGYRDDVKDLIDAKYSTFPTVKAAAEQAARDYQSSISAATLALPDTTPQELIESQHAWCAAVAVTAAHIVDAEAAISAVYERTFNTRARRAARELYESKVKWASQRPDDDDRCLAGI